MNPDEWWNSLTPDEKRAAQERHESTLRPIRQCQRCGTEFRPGRTGRAASYCSPGCRAAAEKDYQASRRRREYRRLSMAMLRAQARGEQRRYVELTAERDALSGGAE